MTTDNGAPTLLPALLDRGHILIFNFHKKCKLSKKLPFLIKDMIFNFFSFIISLNCNPCSWGSIAGVTVADGTLSFAEYIFNYPNYQISRCQNKSKYCPPCPPLRGRLEREIEPKKIQTNPCSFFFHISCSKRELEKKQKLLTLCIIASRSGDI